MIIKRKKTILLISIIAILVGTMAFICKLNVIFGDKVYAISSSNGTDSNPYVVDSASDLKTIAENVNSGLNNGYYGVQFVLGGDIDLLQVSNEVSQRYGFEPIGTNLHPFKGSFDGKGFTVSNLFINREETDYIGLFGVTSINATVKNLTVSGNVLGSSFTAGVVGYNKGTIENCSNSAIVNAKDDSIHVGGICGYNEGVISNSNNQADLSFHFVSFVGGVVGNNLGKVVSSYNMGNIKTTDSIVGGVVGYNTLGSELLTVFNRGEVIGDSIVGGISGGNDSTIKNAYNTGIVTSDSGTAGGVVGNNELLGVITNVYNTANVLGRDNVAGLVGLNSGILQNGVFNHDNFDGEVSNSGVVIDCFSLSTREMIHSDTLTNGNKLAVLTNENNNVWFKRDYDLAGCYYPELIAFKDVKASDSKLSARIDRKQLSENQLSLNKLKFVYSSNENEPTVFLGSLQLVVGLDYEIVFSDNVNAGSAQAEITLKNYFRGVITKTFEIEKALLQVDCNKFEFVYNASVQHPIVSRVSGNFQSGIVFDYIFGGSINAGEYSMQIVLQDNLVNSNYYLSNAIIEYKINKANLSIKWSKDNFIYNGQKQTPSIISVDGLIGSEVANFYFEFETDKINAGKHTMIAYLESRFATSNNYILSGNAVTYQISKRNLTVNWDNTKIFYNGNVQFPTAEIDEGLIAGDDVNLIYSRYENNRNSNEQNGCYVQLTVDNDNYNLDILHSYSIYRASIKIEWMQSPLLYSGKPQAPNFYIADGRIDSEDILFDVSDYSNHINSSEDLFYNITVKLKDDQVSNNYYLEPITKSYGIKKAVFNLKQVDFKNQVFGFDGQIKKMYISSELPIGVAVEYDNNSAIEIGAYSVKAKFFVDEANYTPLGNNTISATMYITNKYFEFESGSIHVEFNGNLVYGASLNLKESKEYSHFNMKAKTKMYAYSLVHGDVTYNSDMIISVSVDKKQLNSNGLVVLYRNENGEIITANHEIINGQIVFAAKDIVDFIILKDASLLWLWITLPFIVCAMLGGAFWLVQAKKRKRLQVVTTVKDDDLVLETEKIEAKDNDVEDSIDNDLIQDRDFISILTEIKDFVFDGVKCKSIDLFLKSLNFKNIDKQISVCNGNLELLALKETMSENTVYWKGKRLREKSRAWRDLIARLGAELQITAIVTQQDCEKLIAIAKESINEKI